MLLRLRQTTWRDWLTPIQVLLGLALLAVAIAAVPAKEASGSLEPCAGGASCPSGER
jgi:hypothetical protein